MLEYTLSHTRFELCSLFPMEWTITLLTRSTVPLSLSACSWSWQHTHSVNLSRTTHKTIQTSLKGRRQRGDNGITVQVRLNNALPLFLNTKQLAPDSLSSYLYDAASCTWCIVCVWLRSKNVPLAVYMLISCAIPGYARDSYYYDAKSVSVCIWGWCLYACAWRKSYLSIQSSADEERPGSSCSTLALLFLLLLRAEKSWTWKINFSSEPSPSLFGAPRSNESNRWQTLPYSWTNTIGSYSFSSSTSNSRMLRNKTPYMPSGKAIASLKGHSTLHTPYCFLSACSHSCMQCLVIRTSSMFVCIQEN
jgi:hypothetical protein